MSKILVIGAIVLLAVLLLGSSGGKSSGGSSSNTNNGKGPYKKLDGLAKNDKNYKNPWG